MTEFLKMVAQQRQNLPAEAKANLDRLASLLPATSKQSAGDGLKLLRTVTRPKQEEPRTKVVGKQFFLENDWHVLHYVLNGTTEGGNGPTALAVMGGGEIPDHQSVMGYGPVRYLVAQEVKAVAEGLESVNPQQLNSRLNKRDAEKKRIFLAHTFDRPSEWEYLPELFERFRDFYRDAAAHGNAMAREMY